MSRRLMGLAAVMLLTQSMWITGCARMEAHSRDQAFREDVDEYGRMLRWGFYDAAAAFLRRPPADGPEHPAGTDPGPAEVDTAALKPVRVTNYEIVSQRFSPSDPNRATVRAHVEYYREDSPTVREITDEQHWWYDEDAGRWYLDGTLPDFSR